MNHVIDDTSCGLGMKDTFCAFWKDIYKRCVEECQCRTRNQYGTRRCDFLLLLKGITLWRVSLLGSNRSGGTACSLQLNGNLHACRWGLLQQKLTHPYRAGPKIFSSPWSSRNALQLFWTLKRRTGRSWGKNAVCINQYHNWIWMLDLYCMKSIQMQHGLRPE